MCATKPVALHFFSQQYWGLNPLLCTCQAGALPLDPGLQAFLLLFWRWGLTFAQAVLDCDPSIYASHCGWDDMLSALSFFSVEMVSCELFCPGTAVLLISCSQES
jgi:hypothetical protein